MHRLERREAVHHLLRQPRVHVVDVGDAEDPLRQQSHEGRLLHRVDDVVAPPADHAQDPAEHEGVAGQLLQREAGPHAARPGRDRDPVDPAVGDARVLPLGEGEDVHLVPFGGEHLEERPLGDRRATRLEERVGGKEEDPHGTASPTLSLMRDFGSRPQT
jgi:hypothetical protein